MSSEANLKSRLLQLRKQHKWSRDELAEKIGTSSAIIGRYERDDITPSVEVARKIAHAFGVSLDYLVGDADVPETEPRMHNRLELLKGLDREEQERILFVFDSLLRDAQHRNTQQKLAG